jgi:hypothetical protein
MSPVRQQEEPNLSEWAEPDRSRCLVCGKESGGKVICGDDRCARELADG